MGCTPSKSVGTHNQDAVYGDLDTCSTIAPSLKSSVSTPERPAPRCVCVETSSGKQTFLNVPGRDIYGRSVSQPSSPDAWRASGHFSVKPFAVDAALPHEHLVPPDPSPACSTR